MNTQTAWNSQIFLESKDFAFNKMEKCLLIQDEYFSKLQDLILLAMVQLP